MSEKELRKLRNQLDKALKKEKAKDALELLEQLEVLDKFNARWPHRRGDVCRKLGKRTEAVEAYERAVDLYAKDGFIARAVAMAKTILLLDPSRTDVLDRVDASRAQEIHRANRIPTTITGAGQASILSVAQQQQRTQSQIIRDESEPAEEKVFEAAGTGIEIDLDLSEMEVGGALPRGLPELSEESESPSAESLAVMPLFALFTEVPKSALDVLATGSELVECSDGEMVVRRGDPADALYAIVEGCARVEVPGLADKVPVLLVEGDLFGESCLLEDEPRNADVVVFGKLVALKIPKSVLLKAVSQFPEVGDILFNLLTRRLVGNLLQTSPLFEAFDTSTRREVAKLFEVHRVSRGTLVLQEGERADGLYIPLTGTLEYDDGRKAVRGDVAGQDSLLAQEFSTNTVRAAGEMALLRLPAQSFSSLAAQYPPVLAHLAGLAADA